VLVGAAAAIERLAAEQRIELRGWEVVDSAAPSVDAVRLINEGAAQLLMKGQVPTPALMAAVLDSTTGLRSDRVICQVVLMEIVPHRRGLLMLDTGICIQPSLEQKADMIRHAVALAGRLGLAQPRVAVLAAGESVNPAMSDTVDAAELQRRGAAGAFGSAVVQGPLSFDLAYAPQAGAKKGLAGEVIGVADVLLFPNLAAANLTVKAIMYTADCRFGGVLVGARCPVVFMSRADTVETRLHSLALALQMME